MQCEKSTERQIYSQGTKRAREDSSDLSTCELFSPTKPNNDQADELKGIKNEILGEMRTDIRNSCKRLSYQIDCLRQDAERSSQRLCRVEQTRNYHEQAMNRLKRDINYSNQDIIDVKGDLSYLKGDMSYVKQDIKKVTNQFEQHVIHVKNDVRELKQDMNDLKKVLDSVIRLHY